MLPHQLAEATTAVRVSSRRISSNTRRPSCPHSASQFQARPVLPHPSYPAQRNPTPRDSRAYPIEIVFVDALVRASRCRAHSASPSSPGFFKHSFLRKFSAARRGPHYGMSLRNHSNCAVHDKHRAFLRSLADPSEIVPNPDSPKPSAQKQSGGSRLKLTIPLSGSITKFSKQNHNKYMLPKCLPSSMVEYKRIAEFRKAVRENVVSNGKLFELYCSLPSTRLLYLDRVTLENFITRLITVPVRNQVSMLRYLTLLEDMKASGIPITRKEWNQATSFVTRAFRYTTVGEMRAAFELWAESEGDHSVPADVATFNILLDGAAKARSPTIAHSILAEMQKRNVKYDRYTYTTFMMYHALAGDTDKVRQAYQNLVDAGEIVDTYILNALMTALIHVGDDEAAEKVLLFMKKTGVAEGRNLAPTTPDYRQLRLFAQKLRLAARNGAQSTEDLGVTLAPDVASFHMFIHLHCRRGNWDRVQGYIQDMRIYGFTLPECVYLSLLKGFAWWGSRDLYSQWNVEMLEELLKIVLDESTQLFEWERTYAVWVVRAVAKVYANPEVLEKVWQEIETQWRRQGGTINDFALGVYLAAMRDLQENTRQRDPPDDTMALGAL